MKKVFILFLSLLFSFSINAYAQVTKKTTPTWVDNLSISQLDINKDEITQGSKILLYDQQVHIPKQEAFYRITTKITDNVGIQNASTINVSYDPSYQTLRFHKINIIRDDETIDKLDIPNIQVMRRELNAENHLYDGSLSAVMNITDVRTGDIIDYSYTIKGFNPVHNNKFSAYYYLNNSEPIGMININITSNKQLKYKLFKTNLEPEIIKEQNLYKYKWTNTNTKKLDYEEYTPSWNIIHESVCISEYDSWKDIVDWGVKTYKPKGKIDSKLLSKIQEIQLANKYEDDRIKETLKFVQNDIRYLGIESGIGSYKPFSPNKVFNQRFGDCKDKSLLMVTMLEEMGIEAYPMLVNTYLKNTIKDFLPSTRFFDHCVVKVIDKRKQEYWYDPTISNQGGEFDSTHFPNYEYGLVLKNGNEKFDEINTFSENTVKTLEEYTLDQIGKGAKLKVTTTYHEFEADNIRRYFKSNSIQAIKKEYEKFYSNYYYNVSSTKQPSYNDDIRRNIFTVKEEYQIDSIWKPMPEKENHISVSFIPGSLLNMLYIPTNDTRKNDISIAYPSTKEHKIKVKLPYNWNIKNDKVYINSPGFYYEWKVNYDRKLKEVDIYHYLKTQKKSIGKNEFQQYVKDINKLEQSIAYYLFVPKGGTSKSISNNDFDGSLISKGFEYLLKFVIFLGLIIFIVLLIFWYVTNRNKNN